MGHIFQIGLKFESRVFKILGLKQREREREREKQQDVV
jgi:hypothetical protein